MTERPSDNAPEALKPRFPLNRAVALLLGIIGAFAFFFWATHAANNSAWIQLAAALALWGLHGYVVTRLWRGR